MAYYIFIALGLTTLTLTIGIISMVIGGKINKTISSKLMFIRVILQAISIILLILIYIQREPEIVTYNALINII